MKYISLFVFTAFLIWTWNVIHNESPISFETHSGIQEKMAAIITDTIKAKRPSVSEVLIEKIWTEVISENKVKAFFIYSFKDNSETGLVTSQIKGEGLLERQKSEDPTVDKWALTNVKTSNDNIQFDDSTIITGSATGTPESTPEPTPTPEEQH